jgi:hypothetical protein
MRSSSLQFGNIAGQIALSFLCLSPRPATPREIAFSSHELPGDMGRNQIESHVIFAIFPRDISLLLISQK